jgi:uncharacterized protein (TIGR02147 family)
MRVFDFESYKSFVTERVRAMPQGGRGQYGKIARHLRMHTTMVSQIFRGEKNLSLEQACALAEYFGLSDLETDFFLVLVEHERAGTAKLKRALDRRKRVLRAQATQVGSRLPPAKRLREEDKAVFYSHWYYSGIRLLTSLPSSGNADAIAEYLKLPQAIVARVLEFLLATGLCEEKGGRIAMGPARTHVPAGSPLVARHHLNWRLKAMERFSSISDDELAFTSPMTISREDGPKVREAIAELIEKVSGIVERTEPEKLSVLNIDWVDLRG